MELETLFNQIVDAIHEKDGTADGIAAKDFPDRIRSIPTSGGSGPIEPLDPMEVYKRTRPADWLPMPEPADNEMYLLFHIPDGASSLLAFTVTCTGSCTIATGTVKDGAFVQSSDVTIASGQKYETELFADDFWDLTSTGMKQCMVKVSGAVIKTWEPSTHSKKNSPTDFAEWNVVEIVCRLPNGTKVSCGNAAQTLALRALRYFSWHGSNQVTNMNAMFSNCNSLVAIPQLDTASVTNMNAAFSYCNSLVAIPQLDTASVTNMNSMFSNCRSLAAIPQLDTASVTGMSSMFNSCYSLAAIPQLDTASVTRMSSMFNSCNSLVAIPQLDTASVTNMDAAFSNCNALMKLILNAAAMGWAGCDISLADCSLGHTALVNLFKSLPAITANHKITLTGNPGVSELIENEEAIATSKNWTLVS